MSRGGLGMAAAAAAMLLAAGGAQAGTKIVDAQAQAGLANLGALNLTVFDTLTAGGQETEGPMFVGGTFALGGGYQADFGTSANSGQGFQTSGFAGLTVGAGGVTGGSLNVNAGNNAGAPFSPQTILIAGSDKANTNLNTTTVLSVGGDVASINGSSGSVVTAGGSISGNANGASFVAGQGSAYQSGLANSVAAQTSTLSTDANALASALAGLGATGTAAITNSGNTLLITAADPNHLGYSVVDVPIALLVSNPNAAISFANPNDLTVFIDVTGLAANQSYTIQNNSNDTSQDQLAIWNFGTTAATLNLNNQVVGSLLAPDATIVQSGAAKINGSVVAQDFTQGAEVHLGTFNGVNPFTPGVPEPATWAVLILGMGMIGATARRRREAGALAA